VVLRTPTGAVAEHPDHQQCAEWILPYQRAVLRAGLLTTPAPASRDSGLAVLAALAHPYEPELAQAALTMWLTGYRLGTQHYGSFVSGLAGFVLGVSTAATVWPELTSLAAISRSRLVAWAAGNPWQTDSVDWADYDLIRGPAGTILQLSADPQCSVADLLPPAEQLVRLSQKPGFDGLRVGVPHPGESRGRNLGRINLGVGHGVPGVLAGLTIAMRHGVVLATTEPTLRAAAHWLIQRSFLDELGACSWPTMYLAGEPNPAVCQQQVWCYGTPGISWMLWEAGRELGDEQISDFALAAMSSVCRVWDERRYLRNTTPGSHLTMCHGAAGVLAIADAFARHADHADSACLRDRLLGYLAGRMDEVAELAKLDLTMLTGASGVLAALQAVHGGPRGWLIQFGLR